MPIRHTPSIQRHHHTSPTKDGTAEPFKGLLLEGLCVQEVSLLIQSEDGADSDQSLPCMLTDMMIPQVQVLGSRLHLWDTGQLHSARDILKNAAVLLGNGGEVWNALSSCILQKAHQHGDMAKLC